MVELLSINVISKFLRLILCGETSLLRLIRERKGIDPSKISGPYSLFAVMLLVVEILFGIWFWKAQSSVERIVAGSLMALVFVSLMLFVMRMNQTSDREKI